MFSDENGLLRNRNLYCIHLWMQWRTLKAKRLPAQHKRFEMADYVNLVIAQNCRLHRLLEGRTIFMSCKAMLSTLPHVTDTQQDILVYHG